MVFSNAHSFWRLVRSYLNSIKLACQTLLGSNFWAWPWKLREYLKKTNIFLSQKLSKMSLGSQCGYECSVIITCQGDISELGFDDCCLLLMALLICVEQSQLLWNMTYSISYKQLAIQYRQQSAYMQYFYDGQRPWWWTNIYGPDLLVRNEQLLFYCLCWPYPCYDRICFVHYLLKPLEQFLSYVN